MFVGDIFHKQRKTEPTSVHVLRAFLIVSLLILILSYSGILIFNIYNDNPIFRNWSQEEDAIPVPGIKLLFVSIFFKSYIHYITYINYKQTQFKRFGVST